MKIRHALVALSAAAVLALAGCGEPAEQPESGQEQPAQDEAPEADLDSIPDVVAEVNGEEIGKDEFVAVYEPQFQQTAMMQQSSGEELDEDELKEQVLAQLIDNRLLAQAAEESGIEASDEDVDAVLTEVAQQAGLETPDEVISTLEEQGMSEEEIRADAASQHQITTFLEQEADISEPSEDELREQYDELVDDAEAQGQGEEVPEFEEVRDELVEQATGQEENEAAESIVADLREDADITVHL